MDKEQENPTTKLTDESIETPTEETFDDLVVTPTEESFEEVIETTSREMMKELIETTTEQILNESIETPVEEEYKGIIEKPAEETLNEPLDEPKENTIQKLIKRYKKLIIGIIITLCTFLVIYCGMAKYFINHFYFSTRINGIHVSGKTVQSVEKIMETDLQTYTLSLKERGGIIEKIKADDVGLKYISDMEFKKLKDIQNHFNWLSTWFNKDSSNLTVGFTYDENLLKERIGHLSCFDQSNIVEPKNPSFLYVDNSYVIADGNPGNKVDADSLYSMTVESILNRKTEIDLESEDCYIKAQYDAKSQKVIEDQDKFNKYVAAKITYLFGDNQEIVDGSKISQWLSVDDNFDAIVDEEKVKEYINTLADTYNTIGKTRNFITSSGESIKIGGGDYGWSINKSEETRNIIAEIKDGITMTREPAYDQTAISHNENDIGNTYVEISIAKQHIWFYKNGSLIIQGDVTTGNPSVNHSTRRGIYRLKDKERNVILRGLDYAVPVSFWMPFSGGMGIHDASWRSVFGGNIYKTAGSHGCVNSPYNVAKEIYNNITLGTPVVCY